MHAYGAICAMLWIDPRWWAAQWSSSFSTYCLRIFKSSAPCVNSMCMCVSTVQYTTHLRQNVMLNDERLEERSVRDFNVFTEMKQSWLVHNNRGKIRRHVGRRIDTSSLRRILSETVIYQFDRPLLWHMSIWACGVCDWWLSSHENAPLMSSHTLSTFIR